MRHLRLGILFLCACPGGGGDDAGVDAGAPLPIVTSVSPDRGPRTGGTMVTVNGSNFAEGATVIFGTTAATSVTFESDRRLVAVTPAAPEGRASVTVVNPSGKQTSLMNAFLFEGGTTGTLTDALVLMPATTMDTSGMNPVRLVVRSRVQVPGVTDVMLTDAGNDQGPGVLAQVGVATEGSTSFTWTSSSYQDDFDTYDTYRNEVSLPAPTGMTSITYVIAVRFSVNNGASWVEGDRDGFVNGIQDAQRPRVIVGRKGVEWCKLGGEAVVAPESYDLRIGQMGPTIYGQVFSQGVTNMAGAGPMLTGELGIGDAGTSPETWVWVAAGFNRDTGNGQNDEFMAQLPTTPSVAGDKRFAYRFSVAGGAWAYCDSNGLTTGGFTEDQAGRVRISSVAIDQCRLQFPLALTSRQGQVAGTVYGRVLSTSVTEAMGAGPGIEAQLGFGPVTTLPSDSWTWVNATYNVEAAGGQEEWQAALTGPAPGSYLYAYRFRVQSGPWTYCDSNPADGMVVESQLGVLTAQAADARSIASCKLQFVDRPLNSVVPSGEVVTAYARVSVPGWSEDAGATPGLRGEVGVGSDGNNASTDPTWGWRPATFNVDVPDAGEDEWVATFTPAYTGGRSVSFRFAVDDGGWSYCDRNGSNVNGYEPAQQWDLDIGRTTIEYCNLQFPDFADAGTTIYGRVYLPGVTRDAGAPITAELGFGPKIEDPGVSTRWSWVPATYNANCPGCGNNNEYQAVLPAAAQVGQHYVFRFRFGAATCYGDLNGAGAIVGGFNGEAAGGVENLGVVRP
ncbi:MAG: IPT/TIG domain-containing protein [Myxococcaceae bacterium]|nr:IPT/TIG domain-containing protein [Myxococcaceae bacterium]